MGLLSIIGRLSLDGAQFDRALQNAEKRVNSFAGSIKGKLAGAFGASAFIALGRSAIEAADGIDELSERLGITNRQAQEFSLAAKLGGTDSEFFATKFEKLRKALREGVAKGENPLAAFGLDATADPSQAIEQLAKVIQDTGLNAEQATAMVDLFGKGAGRMVNVLSDLKNARKGALFFSDDDIQNLKTADDLLTKFGNTAKVALAKLIDPKLGPLTQMLGAMGINAFGVLDAPEQKRKGIDETGILDRQAAAEEAAKVHMAVQDRLLKIRKETEEVSEKNRQQGMTDEDKLLKFAKEREDIFKRIATTEEERAQKELDLARNERDILEASKIEKASAVKSKTFAPMSDSLTSVGNFLGANPNAETRNQLSEANKTLRAIERKLDRQQGTNFPL